MTADEISAWLVAHVARAARLDPAAIDVRSPLESYGLSSTDAVLLSGDLEQLLGTGLSPTLVYEHPSIAALSQHLARGSEARTNQDLPADVIDADKATAIVGIGCRFPGADTPAAFWRMLREGRDAIREVPRDRWNARAYYHPDSSVPGKAITKWGGFLDRVDAFDPFFFGISPGEAERMDPQQRLLLELAYEAFEDAGYQMVRLAGTPTGVFVGISINEYAFAQLDRPELINGHSGTGNALSIAANRISYVFDLRGPSMAIDTACSSSLMAVHLACRSLRSGECDVAIAGGVNIMLSPAHSIAFSKAGVLAPDGRCRPFDAGAHGFVRGEGGGLVVLKSLRRALDDHDAIYAVIRGSAAGQDGRTNGLMAPNPDAQATVLRAAYRDAAVSPANVQYVEAHGTGTLLGDAMEARALGAVLGAPRRQGPCALGSVKSNLGHLEAAAGVAGLVKTALALQHRAIPPTAHFTAPNPQVPFDALNLRVPETCEAWPAETGPALAAVSSFGFGGTNVHVVIESAPGEDTDGDFRREPAEPPLAELFLFSADRREALDAVARSFRERVAELESDAAVSLHDICASAALRKNLLACRAAIVARSKRELVEHLDRFLRAEDHPDVVAGGTLDAPPGPEADERSLTLRGIGAIYRAGRDIDWRQSHPWPARPVRLPSYAWQRERFWIGSVDEQRQTHPLLGAAVTAGEPGTWEWHGYVDADATTFLRDHRVNGEVVFPASAYLEMALSAAVDAGLGDDYRLDDVDFSRRLVLQPGEPHALLATLSRADGRLKFSLSSQARGSGHEEWTLHASASVVPITPAAEPQPQRTCSLAAVQERCPDQLDVEEFYRALAQRGLEYGRNMRAITAIRRGSGEAVGRVTLPESLLDETDMYAIHPALVDGAMQVLAATLAASSGDVAAGTYVPTGCRRARIHQRPGASLWSHVVVRSDGAVAGQIEADVRLFDESGACIGEFSSLRLVRVAGGHRPAVRTDQDTWLYALRWQNADVQEPESARDGCRRRKRWIILADRHGVASALATLLESRGDTCRLIVCDDGDDSAIRDRIGVELTAVSTPVDGVIHLWSVDSGFVVTADGASLRRAQTIGSAAAVSLIQQLAAQGAGIGTPRVWLVTLGAQPITADEPVSVSQAPVWGLARSVAFEFPAFQCTTVDLDPAVDPRAASEFLVRELDASDGEDQVAVRGGRRFVPRLLPHRPSSAFGSDAPVAPDTFRADGAYLITGGLGALGLAAAEWMTSRGARHLVLAGRRPPSATAAATVDRLRRRGAEIMVASVDVADHVVLEELLARVRATMPPLRGVIHAAAVLENAPLVDLDAARMSRVMAPKVHGAWNLDAATRRDPLEFFVLFSSAVSVLGSPGQGSYAAANSFLDALAHQRHSEKLPAISLNWGPWADIGMAAEVAGARRASDSRGVRGIDPKRGLELLGQALSDPSAQVTVLPFDLATLLDLYPTAAKMPLFSEVGGRDTHVSRLYARPDLRQPYVAPRNELEHRLAELWRQVLRIDRVGVRDSFFELGGDSVIAAQILTGSHRMFGVTLDVRDAFDDLTIERLAGRVEAALIARVDDLGESEARRLLDA